VILSLIRHANTDATGTAISGRMPGVLLNEHGRMQAAQLATSLASRRFDAIFCSPLERARQTADPLAKLSGLGIETVPALTDIDFGDWTGQLLSKLEPIEKWKQWNLFRSSLRIPGGETIFEVQTRMLGVVERLSRTFPDGRVAIVSHADPIRTVLAHFLWMPLDLLHRIEISPASVTTLSITDWGAQVQHANWTFYSAAGLP
jgi:broad specificity phosphatase PhoE